MSVLIKGMKMPKNCTICRFCVPEADPGNGEMCMATGKYVPPCNTDRLENCPLVEVATPHGRLIDEVFISQVEWYTEDGRYIANAGEFETDAPTIIEAEEGEEA